MTATATSRATPATVLKRAARLVARGWCQKQYAEKDGSVCPPTLQADKFCVVGALRCAAGKQGMFDILDMLNAEVRRTTKYETLALWNDATERTQAEVVAFLRRVSREGSH